MTQRKCNKNYLKALRHLDYTHVCIELTPQDGHKVGATLKLGDWI